MKKMEIHLKISIILTLIHLTSSHNIEITTLDSQILPFNLGLGKIIEDHHTFIHYVEIEPLIKLLDNVNKYFITVNNTLYSNITFQTAALTYRNVLRNSVTQAHYLIIESRNKLDNLAPHSRNKRGLINVIGKASKYLFGTLDSDDAEKYNKAIKILTDNQNSLNKQIQIQTSLTKSLIDNYNHTIITLSKNQELIKERLNHFEHNVYKTFDDISAFIRAQNTLDQIILNCQNLITFLDNLEDSITFAKLKTLHSSVISATNLKYILNTLSELYEKNKIPQFTNILSYYQIADLNVALVQNRIVFSIHMPILNSESFDFFHIYSIPQSNLTIVPPNPFLLLSSQTHQYQEEDCPQVENLRICKKKLVPNQEDCIISTILNRPIQNCHFTKIQFKKTIKQRISNSHVLLIPEEKLKIKRKCNADNIGFVIISRPSLIKIPQHCEIESDDFVFRNEENILEGEPFILPEISTGINKARVNEKQLILHHIDLDEIPKLKERSNDNWLPNDTVIYNPQPSYIFGILTSIIIICLIILLAIKWKPQWLTQRRTITGIQNTSNSDPIQESEMQNNTSVLFSNLRREELY